MNEDNKEEKDDQILKERTEKALSFVKKRNVWVIGFLIIALILAVYIRSLPMQDHDKNTEGLQPGLWDITTNTWTLGPDLDPWFFTRYAETIVEQGSLPEIDEMRNVPLGFETSRETRLLPYMIAGTYYVVKVFNSDANVIFAAALFPVIMFFFTTLVFFLFVREIFTTKEKSSFTRANIIALIATFFMIVIPVFLSRTVAGIPEKESAAFFFMFISFYFFLKSWKSESYKGSLIYGSLAGISTGMMGLIWGGFIYVYVVMGLSTLASFILGKLKKKDITSLALWLFFAVAVLIFFSDKYAFLDLVKTPETGIAFFSLGLMIYHTLIWDTKFSKNNPFKKIKVPKEIISLVSLILIAVILAIIVFGPGFITSNYDRLIDLFVNPTTGRWGVTVAENRQPYFREWGNNFGPFIKNIPIMFWLFFIGSVLLFKEMIGGLKKKDSYVLSALYVFFFFGLVFSRYAPHPYNLLINPSPSKM